MNSNCKILMVMASAVITVMDLQRYLMLTGRHLVSLAGRFGRFDYVGFCVDGNGLRIVRQNRDTKHKNLKKK